MTSDEKLKIETEATAKVLRKQIRAKAGLGLDWDKASDTMKNWYRQQAKGLIVGELNVKPNKT